MDSQLPPPPATQQSTPPAPVTTIFTIGDDLLLEIFLRLASLPSLVRAAFACRAFLHAVRSSPTFRPNFRALHPPPLLGLFVRHRDGDIPSFVPLRCATDPGHAAVVRGADFFLTRLPDDQGLWNISDCRDGFLLLHNWNNRLFAAYSPLAGVLHRIPSPPAAVRELYILSSPPEQRHGSFRLVCVHEDGLQVRPVVFSSITGEWQVLPWTEAATIKKDIPDDDYKHCLPPTSGKLVNGRVYWTIRDYMVVLDTATLQFSSMPLPPITEGQRPFVIGDTKDDEELCMVCAIDHTHMVAVWVWKADAEKWVLDKQIVLDEILVLKLAAVQRGFLHLHLMANNEPNTVPICWFFSFCMETKEMKKIFSLYEYELQWSYPYIMPWPSSLVCNKVNPRIEAA